MINWLIRPASLLWFITMSLMLGWITNSLHIQSDMSLFLPRQSSFSAELLSHQLKNGQASRTIFIAIQGGTKAERTAISQSLTRVLGKSTQFKNVQNGQQQLSQREIEFLLKYRYLLSPAIKQNSFDKKHLQQALQQRLDELALPITMTDKKYLPRDPTAELRSIFASFNNQPSINKHDGVWFNFDGNLAIIIATTAASAVDLDQQQQVVDQIKKSFSALNPNAALTIQLTGLPVASVLSRKIIQQESRWFSIAASLAMLITLLLWFRSLRLVLLSALPIFSAIISGLSLVLLWFDSIHGITLVFAITLLGIAIDYPLHLFSHLQPGQNASDSIKKIWPTINAGLLTTMTAFATLLFSNFVGLAQLGLFTAGGLLAAAWTTRFVLPSMINDTSSISIRSISPFTPGKKNSAVFILGCVAFIITGWLIHPPQWEKQLSSLSPLSQDYKQRDTQLRLAMGAGDLRYLALIQGKSLEQLLQHSEQLQPSLDRMLEDGLFEHYDMAARYLPSQRLQNTRKSTLPQSEELQKNLSFALENLPFKPQLFSSFVEQVSASRELTALTLKDLSDTTFESMIKPLLIDKAPVYYAIIRFSDIHDALALEQALAIASEQLKSMTIDFYDLEQISGDLLNRFYNDFLHKIGFSITLIISILFISLHNIRQVMAVILTLALSIGIEISALSLLGQNFTLFHLVSLILVFGLGLDYALFFMRKESSREKQKTFRGLLICASSTFIVFGILSLSKIPVLHIIGMTTALGVALAFLIAMPVASLVSQTGRKT